MAKKLWGGRFTKATDKTVEEFTESISYDCRLIEHDIRGSIAHATMLGACEIIDLEESHQIVKGLTSILEDYQAGQIEFDTSAEDIHMNVEQLLFERIGEPAKKLHTARSRNDQVATDVKLYLREAIDDIHDLLVELQHVALDQADANAKAILPGYTHLQHAQPVLLGHHLMAWFWMLDRDRDRFLDCRKRLNILPLGAGALAGTTFPIDRKFVAKELGFDSVSENSLDSVADRDWASEFISACAILMIHLSRFSEEFIIWNSTEFGFVQLDDSVTTGSSIMPQKKNPDVAELVRGKSSRVIGDLMSILSLQKSLPLAYNRDLQEDKERLFDAVDTVQMSLKVFGLMLSSAVFNTRRMYEAAGQAFSTATDLADALVRRGVPFRTAHEQVGALVGYCVEMSKELGDLTLDEIRNFAPDAPEDVDKMLTVEASVAARKATGGTALSEVKRQIRKASRILGKL
ncbi:MAG: argininosuccinate lyase [Armatimonadetes bacterium]|nr:argininosuccinate lyase [Armatimonadota bacterium]